MKIRMRNNAPGGSGNDLAIDDITFRPCGLPVTTSINGQPDSIAVCSGDITEFTLTGNANGYTNPALQWQVSIDSGKTWTNIVGANGLSYVRPPTNMPGIYKYKMSVSTGPFASCNIYSAVLTIVVKALLMPFVSNNGPLCIGDTLKLKAVNGNSYQWSGPMNFSSNDPSPFIATVHPGNAGVYYVMASSANSCSKLDSTKVVVMPTSPTVQAGIDTAICVGESIQLDASGTNVVSYRWAPDNSLSNPNIHNPLATPSINTMYILTATNVGCKAIDSVMVKVFKKPAADAGPDKVIISGQTTALLGNVSGMGYTFWWTPDVYMSSSLSLNPEVKPPADVIYTLNVRSDNGCGTAKDEVQVTVYKDIYIPTAFTPNNDGLNDAWRIITLKTYPKAEVKVFNRWGEVVYKAIGGNVNWDGKYKGEVQPTGIYCYIIDLNNGMPSLRGTVRLIH